MSIKRMIPKLLLLTLVVGLAACQMDRLEEGVQATAEKIVAQKGETPDIDESVHVKADKDEIHEETAAKEEAADEHRDVEAAGEHENSEEADEYSNMEEAIQAVMNNLPEFVPPKPALLDIEGDALAYAMGDPDAPVQIIEFTDYQCPFCARHSVATMPDVIENLSTVS